MKVTVKNLTQQSIEVEIDADKTVKDLKTLVEEKFGADYPAASQKLIYAGKILDDSQPLSVYNIDSGKFVVVMVMREKRVAPPAAPEPASSASSSKSTAQPDKAPVAVPASAPSNPDSNLAAAAAGAGAGGGNSLVVGEEYEKTVSAIVGMGYSRPQVEQALAVSFNNPERAIEYLVNGIPENSLEMMAANAADDDDDNDGGGAGNIGLGAAAAFDAANNAGAGAQAAGAREGAGALDFLRNQPQFQRMCAAVQRNPNLLNTLLQEINETNPSFINTIRQNQEEFLRLLNIRPPRQQMSGNRAAQNNRNAANVPQPEQQQPQQQSHSIYINAEDKRAIDNLKSLGFSEQLAIEAYFACDKNENSAANFLLSQQFDE